MEKTFIMIKPDGVQRGLVGEIIRRFEQKGFQLLAAKFFTPSRELAEKHYAEHREKPFFGELVDFVTSGPVMAMVWGGDDIIQMSRAMIGKTKPVEAAPGTIRGDFAIHTGMNIIHGSDSPESAEREIATWFRPEEIQAYEKTIQPWI